MLSISAGSAPTTNSASTALARRGDSRPIAIATAIALAAKKGRSNRDHEGCHLNGTCVSNHPANAASATATAARGSVRASRCRTASSIRRSKLATRWSGLPAIASLAIFQFLWTWNDLLVALVFGGNTKPITVAIFTQLRSFSANIDIIGPAAFVSLAIPLAVFFAFQRYFVQGLLAGSVK